MDDDPLTTLHLQPDALVTYHGAQSNKTENYNVVWRAAESLTSPDLETRYAGVKQLVEQDAVRHHPLIAYLLISRLAEPDIALRAQIVDALADVVIPDGHGEPAHAPSFPILTAHLMEMRTRQIYALLQVADFDKSLEPKVVELLDHCSFAGGHLADILSSRSIPLALRKQAAYFIGQIGYLDALPTLERMAARLEARCSSRNDLGDMDGNDVELLSLIRRAIDLLRAP
jgi:hypothetical protein